MIAINLPKVGFLNVKLKFKKVTRNQDAVSLCLLELSLMFQFTSELF